MITAKECRIGGPSKPMFMYIPKERVDEFSWKGKAAGHREPPKRVNQKHAHKINDRELDAIRYLYLEAGVTQCALATAFCLNQGTVSKIVRGIYHPYELGDFISETRKTGRKPKARYEEKLLEPLEDFPGVVDEEGDGTDEYDWHEEPDGPGFEETLALIEAEGNDARPYLRRIGAAVED